MRRGSAQFEPQAKPRRSSVHKVYFCAEFAPYTFENSAASDPTLRILGTAVTVGFGAN